MSDLAAHNRERTRVCGVSRGSDGSDCRFRVP